MDVALESDKKEVPPCIIQKSDGAALYATSDLATIIDRKQSLDPGRDMSMWQIKVRSCILHRFSERQKSRFRG